MILRVPDVANLGSFKALCCEDAEIDFFNNIVHLQVRFCFGLFTIYVFEH